MDYPIGHGCHPSKEKGCKSLHKNSPPPENCHRKAQFYKQLKDGLAAFQLR
jgi:hypothetical protein